MKRHRRVRGKSPRSHNPVTTSLNAKKKSPHYLRQRRHLDGIHFRCRKLAVMKSCPCRNCSVICPMCNYLVLEISVNLFLCFGVMEQTAPQLELRLCSLVFNETNGEVHVPTALSLGENSLGTLQRLLGRTMQRKSHCLCRKSNLPVKKVSDKAQSQISLERSILIKKSSCWLTSVRI